MGEIEERNDDIDIYKLVFISSSKETFNFNKFRMLLNFLSAIYNGEISSKKQNLSKEKQKKKKKSYNLGMNQKNLKKDIDGVLMHAKDLLKCGNKIINALK